jgi:hypothetical protein
MGSKKLSKTENMYFELMEAREYIANYCSGDISCKTCIFNRVIGKDKYGFDRNKCELDIVDELTRIYMKKSAKLNEKREQRKWAAILDNVGEY